MVTIADCIVAAIEFVVARVIELTPAVFEVTKMEPLRYYFYIRLKGSYEIRLYSRAITCGNMKMPRDLYSAGKDSYGYIYAPTAL